MDKTIRGAEVTALTKDMIIGRPITMMLAEDLARKESFARFYEALEELFEGSASHIDLKLPLKAKHLGECIGHVRLSAVPDSGSGQHVVSVVRAAQADTETRPVEAPAEFPALVEEAAAGLCAGIDEKIRHVNRRFGRLVRHSVNELIDRQYLELVTGEDQEKVRTAVKQLPEEKYATTHVRCLLQRRGGQVLPGEIYLTRVIHEGAMAVNFIVIARPQHL